MRVGMVLDWWLHATSLVNLSKNMFREVGLLMNQKKTFTIAGITNNSIGVGEIDQHFDCVHIPNMGGYRFINLDALSCQNLILSPSGIDEVVLGNEVFKSKKDWEKTKPIIDKEVGKWKKYNKFLKAVHVVTDSEKQDMMKYLDIPEEKIYVIPHGVDHNLFKPPIDKENTRKKLLGEFFMEDHSYFIHVSESNWARKNIFNLLEAFKKAKDEGLKQKLIIVGKNDPIVYEKSGKIGDVKMTGFVSNEHLVKFLGCADAILLPSKHEGFGLPLLEAMACGTPSVTSNIFSPPEVVGDSSLLVDPYDVSDIAKKIFEMGKNENLRTDLSKKAFEHSQKYSWKKTAEKLVNLYELISSEKNVGNFEENLDLAGYRTLTTICQMNPQLRILAYKELMEFDYHKIINWAIEVGLREPDSKDFLIPFTDWLIEKREE